MTVRVLAFSVVKVKSRISKLVRGLEMAVPPVFDVPLLRIEDILLEEVFDLHCGHDFMYLSSSNSRFYNK
jgi:hypothetical protein